MTHELLIELVGSKVTLHGVTELPTVLLYPTDAEAATALREAAEAAEAILVRKALLNAV